MKTFISFLFLSTFFLFNAQVGINTENPQSTLHVVGDPTESNVIDGIIPPKITGDQLAAKTYNSSQTGAIMYISSLPSDVDNKQTNEIENTGLHYFNGTQWKSLYTQNNVDRRQNFIEMYHNGTISLPQAWTRYPIPFSVAVKNKEGWFNSSNGKFTPQKEGYWLINVGSRVYGGASNIHGQLVLSKNDVEVGFNANIGGVNSTISKIIYFNGTTDNVHASIGVGDINVNITLNEINSFFTATYLSNLLPSNNRVIKNYVDGNPTPIIGDIKKSLKPTDHNGWIKLDGRSITGLTSIQQTNATNLGFTTTLPNADNSYLAMNGTSLGSVSGENTLTLNRNQLPKVSYSFTTTTNGNHTHTYPLTDFDGDKDFSNVFNILENTSINANTGTAGSHTHTGQTEYLHSSTSTDPQTDVPLNLKTLSVNMFVYLGE